MDDCRVVCALLILENLLGLHVMRTMLLQEVGNGRYGRYI